MVQKRDEALSKVQRREMAHLLDVGKIDSARIRVENIIRSDITTELHEILELYCELLIARAGLLDGPVCDPGLEEAVKSIIYAAPKTEIKELSVVRTLLAEKYGKEFVLAAMDNTGGKVSDKVVRKLSVTPPKEELVVGYLAEIAKAYNVDWPKREPIGEPPDLLIDDFGDDDDNPSGGMGELAAVLEPVFLAETPLAKTAEGSNTAAQQSKDPLDALSSSQTQPAPANSTDPMPPKTIPAPVETAKPAVKTQEAPKKKAGTKGPDGSVPDVAELERRFAALKKLG